LETAQASIAQLHNELEQQLTKLGCYRDKIATDPIMMDRSAVFSSAAMPTELEETEESVETVEFNELDKLEELAEPVELSVELVETAESVEPTELAEPSPEPAPEETDTGHLESVERFQKLFRNARRRAVGS